MGALALVEDGKLTLDGDINQFLKSWKVPANAHTAKAPVTLERLLFAHRRADRPRLSGLRGGRKRADGAAGPRRRGAREHGAGPRGPRPGNAVPLLGRRLHDRAARDDGRDGPAVPGAHAEARARPARDEAEHVRPAAPGRARRRRRRQATTPTASRSRASATSTPRWRRRVSGRRLRTWRASRSGCRRCSRGGEGPAHQGDGAEHDHAAHGRLRPGARRSRKRAGRSTSRTAARTRGSRLSSTRARIAGTARSS